jgi:hypothetical protein
MLVDVDEIEFDRSDQTFRIVAREAGRSIGRGEKAVFQRLEGTLLGVNFRDVESQLGFEVG